MSKLVASSYVAGIVCASFLTFGAVATVAMGQAPSNVLDWLTLVAFSGLPLAVLLLAAARMEWRQKAVDGRVLFSTATALFMLIAIGLTAHVDFVSAIFACIQLIMCAIGYYYINRDKA